MRHLKKHADLQCGVTATAVKAQVTHEVVGIFQVGMVREGM